MKIFCVFCEIKVVKFEKCLIVKETVSCGFDRIGLVDTTSNDILRAQADVENYFR